MAANPLPDFLKIGPRTSLYTPPNAKPGQLIILCTWLGAARKHIAKYTSEYQSLAPEASILLIKCNAQIIASTYKKQRQDIIPAVSIVLDTLATCGYYNPPTPLPLLSNDQEKDNEDSSSIVSTMSPPAQSQSQSQSQPKPQPHILLHMFSNGGTNTATQLLLVLNARYPHPLPLVGALFDSSPAHGTLKKSHQAMVLSMRPQSTASWVLANVIVSCIMFVLYSWIAWGNENPAALMRRTLLDEGMVGGVGSPDGEEKHEERSGEERAEGEGEGLEREGEVAGEQHAQKGRVAYLFSEADRQVDWQDIKEHAVEARRKGWEVHEIVFEGSDHCAHFSKDKTTYVDAMSKMWCGSWTVEEK